MRVLILNHEKGEHSGAVEDYISEFERYKGRKIKLVSLESLEGDDLAKLYGIVRYPAVLAMAKDGSLQYLWQGLPLPLMDELSYYAQDNKPVVRQAGHATLPLALPA